MKNSNRFAAAPNLDDAPQDDAPPFLNAAADDDSIECVDPLEEEIAGYLDDELSSEDRAAFERRLADDPDLRRRVDEERSAWDALELLDAPAPNPALTETTVDRLNSETQNELKALERAKTLRRRSRRLLNYGIAALCAIVGFSAFAFFFPNVQTRRERDFRVVERLAQLEIVGDFEYLTALDRSNLFAKPYSTEPPFFQSNETPDGSSSNLPTRPNAPRRPEAQTAESSKTESPRTFAELSQDRVFYRFQQKFERLDPATQEKRRQLYRQIADAPNADRLWNVLDNYCAWRLVFPNENFCDRLTRLPVDQRVAEIRRHLQAIERMFEPFQRNVPTDPDRTFKPAQPPEERPFEPSSTVAALRSALPEELQAERLVPLYQKYAGFLEKRGGENDFAPRREGILAFLGETTSDELLAGLSQKARDYLASLPEEERMSAFGLLVSLSVCEQEDRASQESRPFQKFDPGFARRPNGAFGDRRFGKTEPFRGDSNRELAETLRNAPQEVRDFLTSRPAEEMRGRLWAFHWGFAQFAPFDAGPGGGPGANGFNGFKPNDAPKFRGSNPNQRRTPSSSPDERAPSFEKKEK